MTSPSRRPAVAAAERRVRLAIEGTVQGVGFRPFVHRLAHVLGLDGAIGNDDAGVWCEVQGPSEVVDEFTRRLVDEAPPLARVDRVRSQAVAVQPDEVGFRIEASSVGDGAAAATIPPDVAPCGACSAEVDDPADRRHGYPFTCCTDCGPRYTVVDALPYDRARTSMAEYPPCADCAREYASPGGRRHHAQAVCCPACGPRVSIAGSPASDPLASAVAALLEGRIVALKGVGGFQLLCRADDDDAVRRLRVRKRREEKPLALLVAGRAAADALVDLDDTAARAITAPEAPIVLAPRRSSATVAPSVAPDSTSLGVMLPASPLHRLIADMAGVPLVCTSGNLSDEPIAIDDADAEQRLGDVADVIVLHDRRIVRRADDSVVHTVGDVVQVLRRARGFAPRPVALGADGPPVLGVGAMLKSTVALALDRQAHVSVHLGDLDHPRTLEAFEHAISDLLTLMRTEPALVVHDLHPEYLSTKFALAQEVAPVLGVQHHHAHLASCLAEHRVDGPAIGVTFDGFGWGVDGTLWGGEFLIGDAGGYTRAAHLVPVPVPGGAAAVREPWRMAIAHLDHAYPDGFPRLDLLARHADAVDDVRRRCAPGQSITTSSIGRLFDAVAAFLSIADVAAYEGQAAIRLEQQAASGGDGDVLPFELLGNDPVRIDPAPLARGIVERVIAGDDSRLLAATFQRSVAHLVTEVCTRLREGSGVTTVALTGGVFQNRLLNETVVPALRDRGFTVLLHSQVPPNDGGISLGQVAVGRAALGRGTVDGLEVTG